MHREGVWPCESIELFEPAGRVGVDSCLNRLADRCKSSSEEPSIVWCCDWLSYDDLG